jgi:hypothetical protein
MALENFDVLGVNKTFLAEMLGVTKRSLSE